MPLLPKRPDATTTPNGKRNPLHYCAACTRTVNTALPVDYACSPGAFCVRRMHQKDEAIAPGVPSAAPGKP